MLDTLEIMPRSWSRRQLRNSFSLSPALLTMRSKAPTSPLVIKSTPLSDGRIEESRRRQRQVCSASCYSSFFVLSKTLGSSLVMEKSLFTRHGDLTIPNT